MKIVDFLGEKLVKMLGFCQNGIFGQKFDFSNSVSLLWFVLMPNYVDEFYYLGPKVTDEHEDDVVLDFLAVDNFDSTRKIVKKIWGEKLVKMLGFCQYWIFGQKFDFSNSVQL